MYRNRITHILGESISGTGMGTGESEVNTLAMNRGTDIRGVLKGQSFPDCPQVVDDMVGATGIEPVTLSLEG
jgi:hypothetical protein